MKFCKNCRHARPEMGFRWMMLLPPYWFAPWVGWRLSWKHAKCNLGPYGQPPDLVTGELRKAEFYHCSTMRAHDCGPDARHFEARSLVQERNARPSLSVIGRWGLSDGPSPK